MKLRNARLALRKAGRNVALCPRFAAVDDVQVVSIRVSGFMRHASTLSLALWLLTHL